MAAALHRPVSDRAAVLALLTGPPKQVGWLERLILRLADGILVDGEAAALGKMQRRVEHDLTYTDRWSLGLDQDPGLTMAMTLLDRNAY